MSSTQEIINKLNNTIGSFTGNVNARIEQVNSASAQVRATADKTLGEINKFKRDMIENEQMQSAQENILRINQMLRERFADYDTIRKTVMGVVKDFDLNLVRNKTIEELSEELWITSSRYWLAYTMIALSAWVNDNKHLADNAVSESYRTDEAKTSLFFCLTNLRFGRTDVAHKWLTEYFQTIVPDDLKNEASIMLQAYINGVFGVDEQLQYQVQSFVDEWIAQISNDETISNELVNIYAQYIKNIKPAKSYAQQYINMYCENHAQLSMPYLEAQKYDALIKKIKQVDVENIVQNAANYKKRIDAILKDLITNYDQDEKELKEQQEYFQLIIDNKGKEDVAEAQYNEMMKIRYQKENFGKRCVAWALYSQNDEINVHVRKFGFQNTRPWLLKAIADWLNDFEAKFPNTYKIKIDDWSCESNGDDQAEQVAVFREYLEKNKNKTVWDKKVIRFMVLGIIFVTILLAGLLVESLKNAIEGLIGIKIFGIIFGALSFLFILLFVIRLLTGNKRFMKKVNEALQKLNGTMNEIVNYRKEYFINKDKKGELFSLIEHL